MYRYGIVSAASIAGRFVEGLRLAGDEVIAIAARDLGKAQSVAKKLSIPEAYDNYEAIYNHPEVDIVYIPVINMNHYACAKAALLAGKHVVLEKPFTLTQEQAVELKRIAGEKKFFLFEGVKNLFVPSTDFIKAHLPEIGPVNYICTRQGTKAPFPAGHWMLDISKGGGAYIGSCEYVYQYLLYLFGGHVTDLQGCCRRAENSDIDCTFTFKIGDILVSSTILMSSDCDNITTINGMLGRIEIDHFWRSHDVKVILNSGKTYEFHDVGNEFVHECRHIHSCISQGLLESPVLPLARSIEVVGCIRKLYTDWGMMEPPQIAIRKAEISELPALMEIYATAKCFMETHGNQNQWTGDDAVTENTLKAFLENGQLYVGQGEGQLHIAFAYIQGDDPTYGVITDGAWLNDEPYGTVHRLASRGTVKGAVKMIADWALRQNPNLRIDTHHDNTVMQGALVKAGFTRCGIIYLPNGDPRIAYQKVRGDRP